MVKLDRHSIELLEFDKIKDRVADLCFSGEGRDLCINKEILIEKDTLEKLLDMSGDLKRRIQSDKGLPHLSFPPIVHCFSLFEKEGTLLEAPQIADIGTYLVSAAKLKAVLTKKSDESYSEALAGKADYPDLKDLSRQIFSLFEADGSIREKQIPELVAIRKKIRETHRDIASISTLYLHDNSGIWQSDVPTQKDGRTVLPVKANFKGKVKGIVHEVSSRGATLFIEPYDLIEKNNNLVELENRYLQVVLKILREITAKLRDALPEIKDVVERVAFLDSLNARARYAVITNSNRAEILTRGLHLKGARHPLLEEKAIPIDLSLTEETKILIITGPNTGGKTVTLKTAGLFAMMNQFALEIPAEEGSGLPVFDNIWADIGDDQSIEASLSTFSGHMRRIAEIIEKSTANSLVLLDELGSGTDPAEGSSLGMAILDKLLVTGSQVLTSSHHGVMKNYGYTRKGAANASVAFDELTHKPTYRIIHGLPGESHAMDIAERNGLPTKLVKVARRYLEGDENEISRIIRELMDKQKELFLRQDDLEKKERALLGEQRKHDLSVHRVRQKEQELKKKGYGELSRFMTDSRKELENLVRELREGEITREKTRQVKNYLQRIEEKSTGVERSIDEVEAVLSGSAVMGDGSKEWGKSRKVLNTIHEGIEVFSGTKGRRGTVIRKERGGKWLVSVGSLRLAFKEEELRPVPPQKGEQKVGISISDVRRDHRPEFELDLRGKRLEDAIHSLELQIDRALMDGLLEFSVIHGMGEGVLQKGVHDYLRKCPGIQDFFFSHPEQGGFGKTIVRLDSST